MSVSQDAAHIADRHLEEAQALMKVLKVTADHADDGDWQTTRQGLAILSGQIDQLISHARDALDEV